MIHTCRNIPPFTMFLALLFLVGCDAQSPTKPQLPGSERIAVVPDSPSPTAADQTATLMASDSDRSALTALFNATNGPEWISSSKWLSDAPPGEWHGVSADNEGRVIGLDLSDNNLQGALPSEVADMVYLKTLNLSFNTGLVGQLPRVLVRSDYDSLSLEGTGLCIPSDDEMLAWLNGIRNHSVGTCDKPGTQSLVALAWLYNATFGREWRDKTNWLSDAPIHEWHGITVDARGRVTEVNLSDNRLKGPLPATISDLEDLKNLNLSRNPDLVGPLPTSLSRLSLESLDLSGTRLCVPANIELQEWLGTVSSADGVRTCAYVHRDWEALAALYATLNGPDWTDNTNWFSNAPLDDWYGVYTEGTGRVVRLNLPKNNLKGMLPAELGQLENLRELNLSSNAIRGRIPPELGGLINLEILNLFHNFNILGEIPEELGQLVNLKNLNLAFTNLGGPIPSWIGNLRRLEKLRLHRCSLSGEIPPELGQLKALELLTLTANNVTGEIPPELGQLKALEVLYLPANGLSGEVPPELGQLTKLRELYLEQNRLTGEVPPELGQLTKLRELRLDQNGLTGEIPPELGQLTKLRELYLDQNGLTGEIPPELGRMAALSALNLGANAGLKGTLPASFTNLGNLESLILANTQICAPADGPIREWLNQIQNGRVATCHLELSATAHLIQAIQSMRFPVPLVAGEDALLRVFLKIDGSTDIRMPPVRATFYQRDLEVHTSYIPGRDTNVPRVIDEGTLDASANAVIPGEVVMPGLEYVVVIDPEGTLDSEFGIARRIPETGRMTLDVMHPPTFEFTLLPYLWTDGPDLSVLTITEGFTPESDMFRLTRDLLPVSDFSLTVHPPVWTSVDPVPENYRLMIPEVEASHAIEGNKGYAMGIFRRVGDNGLQGIAAGIPSQISFSILDPGVIAHELGHNMNLYHAPCGGADGPDPLFPNEDGSIGTTGFDILTGELVTPDRASLMSYCWPYWISEYSFTRAFIHRMRETETFSPNHAAMLGTKGLLIWGRLDASGDLVLEPAFVVDAAPVYPREDGPYTLEGQRENGDGLFTLSFAIPRYADAEGGSFAFILPVNDDWAGGLDRITLYGPEGTAEINTDGDRFFALMRDSITGEVRGILRDWSAPTGSAAGRRIPPEPGMEITVSNGIPGLDSW